MSKDKEHVSVEIPKEYRTTHTSSVISVRSNINSSVHGMFYCWESFGGYVYYISSPTSSQQLIDPTIFVYVNNALYQTFAPTRTYVGNGHIYECLFGGLSYGDQYYIVTQYGNDTLNMQARTYIGGMGSPPSLYDTGTAINASLSSPYNKSYSMALGILSFDSDYGSLNNYSREARTLLYASCLQSTEQHAILGKVGNFMSFWIDQRNSGNDQPEAYTSEAFITKFLDLFAPYKVRLIGNASAAYYTIISGYINDWISDINTLLGKTWFVRDDSATEYEDGIQISIGSHLELWGYDPDATTSEVDVFAGSWECTGWYPDEKAIARCEVKICNELRGAIITDAAFKDIVYEELTECLGCGNDTYHTYASMFSQIWYIGKNNRLLNGGSPTVDGEVVQMLYNELEIGEVASDVVHKLTPSEGAIIQLPNNKRGVSGHSYQIRPYAMNRQVTYQNGYYYWDSSDNYYSNIGDAITITPSTGRPANWEWTTDISTTSYVPMDSEGFHPVTATEWNNFTNRINEFRAYAGYSNYSFTSVSKGQAFTPSIYNQAVEAIKGISGYGSYLSTISSGTILTADLFLSLRNELNAIP